MKFSYRCSECEVCYPLDPALAVCPLCAKTQRADEPLRGVLEVMLEGAPEEDEPGVRAFLPVESRFFPPYPWGDTPLWHLRRLGQTWNLPRLFVKDDGCAASGSFKDRASVLVSAYAASCGFDTIVLASTGNAGSSMAAVGASAGQRVVLFLPENAPPGKLLQALQYGATIYRVKGNYDLAYELSLEYSRRHPSVNRNTAWNPMTMEGKKTVAFELYRQLGRKAPSVVFVPTGDGCILGGVYKGFQDLLQLGLISKVPSLVAVQARGSNALERAWLGQGFSCQPSATVADSVSVDVPRNGYTALRYLRRYQGRVISVTDEEIIRAQQHLACHCGLFTEPAGAVAWAGLIGMRDELRDEESVVVLATGNGLKDPVTAWKGVVMPEARVASAADLDFLEVDA